MTHFIRTTKGFTLLETLASIAVLSLVVVGPLAVTISSSGYARLTKDTIVATYLAEEAVELLQNQYDTLYVYCKKNASSTEAGAYCAPTSLETSTGQTSWRLFKDKLSAVDGQPTCYIPKNEEGKGSYPSDATGNTEGCAFDYLSLLASSTQPITRYSATDSHCDYLIPVSTSTTQYVIDGLTSTGGNGDGGEQGTQPSYRLVTSTSTNYVCNGMESHISAGGIVQPKQYKRSITVDQIETFETAPANEQYNDDLRITSNVEFKGLNGISHSVKITRFMHARP